MFDTLKSVFTAPKGPATIEYPQNSSPKWIIRWKRGLVLCIRPKDDMVSVCKQCNHSKTEHWPMKSTKSPFEEDTFIKQDDSLPTEYFVLYGFDSPSHAKLYMKQLKCQVINIYLEVTKKVRVSTEREIYRYYGRVIARVHYNNTRDINVYLKMHERGILQTTMIQSEGSIFTSEELQLSTDIQRSPVVIQPKLNNPYLQFYIRCTSNHDIALEGTPQDQVVLSEFKGRKAQTWCMDKQSRLKLKFNFKSITPLGSFITLVTVNEPTPREDFQKFYFVRVRDLPKDQFSEYGVPALTGPLVEQMHPHHHYYRIMNSNGTCLACKYGMIANGADVVLEEFEKEKISQMWFVDCLPSYTNQATNSLGGTGNRTYAKILDENVMKAQQTMKHNYHDIASKNIPIHQDIIILPKTIFWKGVSTLFSIVKGSKYLTQELTGSNLSNYLSGGLVQPSIISYQNKEIGICMPWIKMDTSKFKHIASRKDVKGCLANLSELQQHELFVHMLTDRLVSNWDTHQFQFGLDANTGSVVSFDKEWSFERFSMMDKYSERRFELDLERDVWKDESAMNKQNFYYIYIPFAKSILSNAIKIDRYHPLIMEFFHRCESISYNLVENFCWDYAKTKHPKAPDEFIKVVYNRIIDIRRATFNYFLWNDRLHPASLPQNKSQYAWNI